MHIGVGKPKHAISVCCKPSGTSRVVHFLLYMRITIQFYSKPCARAVEVKNVAINQVLLPKTKATQLLTTQPRPQLTFSGSPFAT